MKPNEIPPYKNFKIQKFNLGNIDDFIFLFSKAFQRNISKDFVINKHIHCHGEHKYIGFIAYDQISNEPAAFYGVYPGYIQYKNETFLVAQSGDTMTNPKFQKQGLFTHLANITFEYCKEIGINLITGLPNTNSYHGFIKHLQFNELPPFENLILYQNRLEFCRITKYLRFFEAIHLSYAKLIFRLLAKKGAMPKNSNSQSTEDLAYMIHDEDFFKTKIKQRDVFVKIESVDVWLRMTNSGFIIADVGEGIAGKEKEILKKIRFLLILSGYRFVTFGSSLNSFLHSRFNNLAIAKSRGYTVIVRVLHDGLPTMNISLLSADADVF